MRYFYYLPGVTPIDMQKGIEQTKIIASDDINALKKNSAVLISNSKVDFSEKKYDVVFVRASASLKSYVIEQIKTNDYEKDVISIVEYYLKLAEQVTEKFEGDIKVLCDAYYYDFCIVAEHMSEQIKLSVNKILNNFAKESSIAINHSKTDAIFDQIKTGINHSFILCSFYDDSKYDSLISKLKNLENDEEKRAELALFTALCIKRCIENTADINFSSIRSRYTYEPPRINDYYKECEKDFDRFTRNLIEQYSEDSFAYDALWSMIFSNTCLMKTLIQERGLNIQEYYNSMGIYPIFYKYSDSYYDLTSTTYMHTPSAIKTVIPFVMPTLLNFKIHEVPFSYSGFFNHFYDYVWNVIAALKYKDENLLCARIMLELLALAISFPLEGVKLLKSNDLTNAKSQFSCYVKTITYRILEKYDIYANAAEYSWAKEIANSELRWVNSSPFHDVINLLDMLWRMVDDSRDKLVDHNDSKYYGSYVATIYRFLMELRSDIVTCNLLDISLKDYIEYMSKLEKFADKPWDWIADSSVLRFAVATKYLYSKENNVSMLDINYLGWSKAVKDILENLSNGNSDEKNINLAKYIDNYIEIAIAEEENPFMEKGKSIFEEKIMPLISCWENDSKYYATNKYLSREIKLYKLYMSGKVDPIVVDTGFRMIYRDYYHYFENKAGNTVALELGTLVANSIGVPENSYKNWFESENQRRKMSSDKHNNFEIKRSDLDIIFNKTDFVMREKVFYTSFGGRQLARNIFPEAYHWITSITKEIFLSCDKNLSKLNEPLKISFKPNIR